jgi:hypothetical protein
MAEGKECAHEVSLLEIAADGSKRACGEGLLYDADGRSAGRALALEARVQLPGVASMAQVALNAEAEHLTLTLTVDEAPQSTHVIHLPAQCDPDQVGAKWSKKLKTLTVTLPLLGSQGPDAVRRLNAMHERAVLQDKNSNGASSPGTTVEQLAAKLAAANAAAAAAQQLAPLTAEQLAAKLAATNAAAAAKQHLAAEAATGRLKALMQVAGAAAAGGQDAAGKCDKSATLCNNSCKALQKPLMCAQCKTATYCSKDCQVHTAHRKRGGLAIKSVIDYSNAHKNTNVTE